MRASPDRHPWVPRRHRDESILMEQLPLKLKCYVNLFNYNANLIFT